MITEKMGQDEPLSLLPISNDPTSSHLNYRHPSPSPSTAEENVDYTYPQPSTLRTSEGGKVRSTPVPYVKIFPLCLSRMAEGMIFSVVFPYINEMIRGLGVEEKKVGVWSAMAVSPILALYSGHL